MELPSRSLGFTLIELVITVTVILVLMLIALPSFQEFRQRSALRGASEDVLAFWNQSRLEAAKRNQMVKIGVTTSSGQFCMGADTTTDPADTTPCDCFSAGACDAGVFPADPANSQSAWREVTLFGTPTLGSNNGVVVIEPKRTALTSAAMAGSLSLSGPPGRLSYRLNFLVDQFGRGVVCESSTATAGMSDFANRKCLP